MNRYAQVFHRNARTPLNNRGKIVDMIAPAGVLIAAATRGALRLFFGNARVDGAVELVFL